MSIGKLLGFSEPKLLVCIVGLLAMAMAGRGWSNPSVGLPAVVAALLTLILAVSRSDTQRPNRNDWPDDVG